MIRWGLISFRSVRFGLGSVSSPLIWLSLLLDTLQSSLRFGRDELDLYLCPLFSSLSLSFTSWVGRTPTTRKGKGRGTRRFEGQKRERRARSRAQSMKSRFEVAKASRGRANANDDVEREESNASRLNETKPGSAHEKTTTQFGVVKSVIIRTSQYPNSVDPPIPSFSFFCSSETAKGRHSESNQLELAHSFPPPPFLADAAPRISKRGEGCVKLTGLVYCPCLATNS